MQEIQRAASQQQLSSNLRTELQTPTVNIIDDESETNSVSLRIHENSPTKLQKQMKVEGEQNIDDMDRW